MPKFNIVESKSVIVAGSLVFLNKGELETDDKALVMALSSAHGVELLSKKPTAAELKAIKAAEEDAAKLAAEEAESINAGDDSELDDSESGSDSLQSEVK